MSPPWLRTRFVGLLLCMLVLSSTSEPSLAQGDQRIAAIVNSDVVSNQDLVERIRLALIFSGLPQTEESRRQVAPQVLQRMVDEKLQLQEAARLGIAVSENELIAALTDIAAPNDMSAQQLLTALASEGVNAETLREQTRAELAWVKTVRQVLRPRVVVSEAQIDMAQAADTEAGPDEYRLSEIVLPIYDASEQEDVLSDALELRDAIREGADFASLARQFSIAATAQDGGDMGWLKIDRLGPSLQPVVATLGVGQLSDPVRTPAGMHLILVRERRQQQSAADNPNAVKLSQIFLAYGEAGVVAAPQIEAEIALLRQKLNGCEDINSAAIQLGLPGSGDLGWVVPADMPTELGGAVSNLEPGEISAPIRSANGVHLIGLCQRGGEADDLAIREQIRRSLERAQIERLATRYLRDLRRDGFIDVRVRF